MDTKKKKGLAETSLNLGICIDYSSIFNQKFNNDNKAKEPAN
jgi:hypothetical protein